MSRLVIPTRKSSRQMSLVPHFGSVFDATQTEITEVGDLQLVKPSLWYDNEYGFVTQLIRTLDKFIKL